MILDTAKLVLRTLDFTKSFFQDIGRSIKDRFFWILLGNLGQAFQKNWIKKEVD